MITEARIKEVIGGWAFVKGREHWAKLIRGTMNHVDRMIDHVRIGRLASMPGQIEAPQYGGFESVDALPYVGRDRKIYQGKHQPIPEYAAQLRNWLSVKKASGTTPGLLYALRNIMSPATYRLRLVRGGDSGEGFWWTLDETGLRYQMISGGNHFGVFWPADGSAPVPDDTHVLGWDWDSADWTFAGQNPDRTRSWVIAYLTGDPDITAFEGHYDDGLSTFDDREAGTDDPYTFGTTATHAYAESVLSVCRNHSAAGTQVSHVILTFTDDFAAPDGSGVGYPDGHWKHHGKIESDGSGGYVRVRARSELGRYWLGMV